VSEGQLWPRLIEGRSQSCELFGLEDGWNVAERHQPYSLRVGGSNYSRHRQAHTTISGDDLLCADFADFQRRILGRRGRLAFTVLLQRGEDPAALQSCWPAA
jgi:hypothetical protein